SRSRAKLASLEINRRVRASLQIAALSGNGDFSVVSWPLRAALVVVLMLAYWRTRCFPGKAAMQRVVPCAGQIAEQPIAALPHPLLGELMSRTSVMRRLRQCNSPASCVATGKKPSTFVWEW